MRTYTLACGGCEPDVPIILLNPQMDYSQDEFLTHVADASIAVQNTHGTKKPSFWSMVDEIADVLKTDHGYVRLNYGKSFAPYVVLDDHAGPRDIAQSDLRGPDSDLCRVVYERRSELNPPYNPGNLGLEVSTHSSSRLISNIAGELPFVTLPLFDDGCTEE